LERGIAADARERRALLRTGEVVAAALLCAIVLRVLGRLSADEKLERDERWMAHAIRLAEQARDRGEVPVGCVLVNSEGQVIAEAHNLSETRSDATQHAELVALQTAAALVRGTAAQTGALRLTGCTAYVTLEPCAMCAGALVLARVDRVVYGARDPKAGAVDTLFGIGKSAALNHRFDVVDGVRKEECAALLQAFFKDLRTP
jgi:tRNA(adenine34) deaminase